MKNLLILLLGGALLASPSRAQSSNELTLPEFRQVLLDSLVVLDAERREAYAKMIPDLPDDTLLQMAKAIPNGRALQLAVRSVKARSEAPGYAQRALAAANLSRAVSPAAAEPAATFSPAVGPTSVIAPTYGPLVQPDSPSGPSWSALVGPLITANLLQPDSNGSYAMSTCSADEEAKLTVIVAAFRAVLAVANNICSIIPNTWLGPAKFPFKAVCYAVALIVGAITDGSAGYLADCTSQDTYVGGVQNRAAYLNSLILFNAKIRLKIEQNLLNPGNPIGLFELPSQAGGFLEIARAIVAETINKMVATGQLVSTAATALNQGDTFFSKGQYKLAYQSYQLAYGLASK
jgi:hypothetical protein